MKFMDPVKGITVILLIVLALVSFFGVSKVACSTELHQNEINTIDEKIENVLELSAAATLGSVVASALPGDMATPIADKFSDFGTFFIIILAALYLEKYLICITGYAAFRIMIPLACLGGIWVQFDPNPFLKNLIRRVVLIALAIYFVIPVSVKLTNIIDNTYANNLNQTIESANDTINILGEADTGDTGDEEDGSFISGIVETASQKIQEAKQMLNNMIETVAVMLVTSCVIPLMVLLFFWFLIKSVLGNQGGSMPPIPRLGKPKAHEIPDQIS